MPIQQKLPPPVLLFSDFAGWERDYVNRNLGLTGNHENDNSFSKGAIISLLFSKENLEYGQEIIALSSSLVIFVIRHCGIILRF